MKTRNFIAVLGLLYAVSLSAHESGIPEIRAEYKSIRDALPSLSKSKIRLDDYSSEGGHATAYRDTKKRIRLIEVEIYGELGKRSEEFYYQNGLLIFALHARHRYNVPFYLTPEAAKEIGSESFDPEKTTISEDRYYFEKGRMIRWIDESKKEVRATSKLFRGGESEIVMFSNVLLAIFKQKG